jgi:hypothetical protein
MDAAVAFALDASSPAHATMFRDVFAPGEPAPEPVRARIGRVLAQD